MSSILANPPRSLAPAPDHVSLRDGLAAVVDALERRRADLVDAVRIDAYVGLRWLEWRGGALALTAAGETVCNQYRLDLC